MPDRLPLAVFALALAVAALALVESRRGSRYQLASHGAHIFLADGDDLYRCSPNWSGEGLPSGATVVHPEYGRPFQPNPTGSGRGWFDCRRWDLVLFHKLPPGVQLDLLPDVNPQ